MTKLCYLLYSILLRRGYCTAQRCSHLGVQRGVSPPPWNLTDQLTLFKPGGKNMTNKLLPTPNPHPRFQKAIYTSAAAWSCVWNWLQGARETYMTWKWPCIMYVMWWSSYSIEVTVMHFAHFVFSPLICSFYHFRLVHVVLYVIFWDIILGWYYNILGWKFIIIYFFNWQTET